MIKAIRDWLVEGKPLPHLFAGERLVADGPIPRKKQDAEHHPWWIMAAPDPDEAKRQRKLWMDRHYGGELHPVDL